MGYKLTTKFESAFINKIPVGCSPKENLSLEARSSERGQSCHRQTNPMIFLPVENSLML